jgi:SAM-dependent methyltransferase
MSFFSTLQNWEYLAKKDPLWAILSDPAKKDGRWKLDEFFASGEREISNVLRYLERERVQPIDFSVAVDFGCGVGRLSRALATRFDRVLAIDAAPTMIAEAKRLNSDRPNIEFVLNQEPRLARLADASVSFVYTTLVLQHITYPESLAYVGELLRVLKPGGVAMFQTPTLDRTPLPARLVRAAVRRVVRATRLPLDFLYIDMNVIPTREIEAAAATRGCDLVTRFNHNRCDIGDDGALVQRRAPRFERLVSERFVARKR